MVMQSLYIILINFFHRQLTTIAATNAYSSYDVSPFSCHK